MLHYETRVLDEGKDWVLLLHGLGGSSATWYKQLDVYAKEFNLLTVDFHGHGATRKAFSAYSFEIIARDVVQVLDRLQIRAVHVVSISLGSIIADAFLLMYPERIKSMVVGGGVPGYDLRAKVLLRLGSVLKEVMPYMWLYRLFAYIMMPRKNHARSRSIFVREAHKLGRREFLKWFRLMEGLTGFYEVWNGAVARGIPKLYVSGGQDYFFLPLVRARQAAETNSLLHVIPGCGHVCNIERHDEFNAVSLDYLRSFPMKAARRRAAAKAEVGKKLILLPSGQKRAHA